MEEQQPTFGHGKICYVVIPTADIAASARFFKTVFNWRIREDNLGNASFDDGVGQVSGGWVKGRKPAMGVGLFISLMVDDAEATVKLIKTSGGTITQPIGNEAPEITAHFTDPDGNEWGIYQHRG
ncbi:VOC family protein [Inquilinus sp. KBS0705]|nr:VOC family protein [Inquilinus sp. KBS0705]